MNYRLRRRIAPIDYEPPPLAPDDSIYPGSDEEEPVEEQEADRRRIQSHAQHYLHGGQLFIFSAQLCGPFDGGWVNPWAAKRKRGAKNNGPVFDLGRMEVGSDTAGGRQECKSMTIPETTRPSRWWRNRLNAIGTEILETGSISPTPTAAQKSPDGMLSTVVTKLTPSAEHLHLLPQSNILPVFEYPSSNREVGGRDLEVEVAITVAKAPEEILRTPSFSLNANMQELETNSGNLSARNHEVTPARRLHRFNKERREINRANNPSEKDNMSRGQSTIVPALFNEINPVEIRGEPGAIPPQTRPQKRRRLEENPVDSNADGECPALRRLRELNNANGAMTDTDSPFNLTGHREYSTSNTNDVTINAAIFFNVPDHQNHPPISPPKSKLSQFSTISSRGISCSTKDGGERLQLLPWSLGESGFN